ncbi:MAG: helix-turn-helix domain-containing protein [Bacteroidales bacterium]|nr:helix-turn-helix domain-containing protein [Bacteroidales bacterium]
MFVSAGLLSLLIKQYQTTQDEISGLFAKRKFTCDALLNPVAKIDANILGIYLEYLVKQSGNNRIGLEVGFRLPFVLTSSIYNVYNRSKNVREIFENPEPFEPAANDILTYTNRENNDYFFFEISINHEFAQQYPIASRQWMEMQYGISLQYAYSFTGRYLYPLRAYSVYPREGKIDELEGFLYCPIEFNRDKLTLIFNRSVLDLPIITGNKALYPVFEDYMYEIQQMDAVQNNSLSRTIRRYLMHNLLSADLSLKGITERLNMSERNIQRKLRSEGTSYQQILNGLRMELAQKYIKEKIPFLEIAFLLGFESQSAFNKFFNKHFKTTPSRFR